jgi:hypothetical protein
MQPGFVGGFLCLHPGICGSRLFVSDAGGGDLGCLPGLFLCLSSGFSAGLLFGF